jgi:hypothetical protein
MSKKFAVIDGIDIINTIVAESKEIAEEVTGKTCIELTTEAEKGGTYVDGVLRPACPHKGWIWENNQWTAPTPMPTEGVWEWSDSTEDWVVHIPQD